MSTLMTDPMLSETATTKTVLPETWAVPTRVSPTVATPVVDVALAATSGEKPRKDDDVRT